jgi:hypothetical protein
MAGGGFPGSLCPFPYFLALVWQYVDAGKLMGGIILKYFYASDVKKIPEIILV